MMASNAFVEMGDGRRERKYAVTCALDDGKEMFIITLALLYVHT